ncbi:MAG: putative DNA binding domain-containing protein [Planctomycetes bacterium]|nr:putative DNA binding domain-containing protein [Planctomycetota bacterium]
MKPTELPPRPPFDDELVDQLLSTPEGATFEFKRAGKNDRKLQTIVAFANAEGGYLVLGIEDEDKATGRERVHGVDENPESIDELRRLLQTRITPQLAPPDHVAPQFIPIGCTLRDGSRGSIVIVKVDKSPAIHSIIDGGTYVRLSRSNRQLAAPEITELSMQRGTRSWVGELADVSIELLETQHWREYAASRRLSRPFQEALLHLGLARSELGARIVPTRAAVLLFAEEPSGLLDAKCSIRLFQYAGSSIEHSTRTNLIRPPKTIGGPLHVQIREAKRALVDALATGVQMGPLGFEIVQRYPLRVLEEGITNAVLHRDYRLPADIQIRVFEDRVEIESPGVLPGNVTVANLREVGSRPRNRALVDHLREFPNPPNLDAGEGVRMMFETMERASLYPPLFSSRPDLPRDAVLFTCFNESRPDVWTQVEHHLDAHGVIGNAEVRLLLRTDDTVRASRLLKSWVDRKLLVVADPDAAKKSRRYRRPGAAELPSLFAPRTGK